MQSWRMRYLSYGGVQMQQAERAVQHMGTNAVPALAMLLSNSEPGVCEVATNALLKIAPEVLTNGVAK